MGEQDTADGRRGVPKPSRWLRGTVALDWAVIRRWVVAPGWAVALGWAVCLAFGLTAAAAAAAAEDESLRGVQIADRRYAGRVIARDASTLALLRRDGSLLTLTSNQIDREWAIDRAFSPYSAEQLVERLRREFGRDYRVTASEHYVVVTPRDAVVHWNSTLEKLYRQFNRYFTDRGIQPRTPRFPLIAVVYDSRQSFEQYVSQSGLTFTQQSIGFYSPATNRMTTFESDEWSVNRRKYETMIHEAVHQLAFNTGLHGRFQDTPRWFAEGLAMVFEAPGIYDAEHHTQLRDRIVQDYYQVLQQLIADGRHRGSLIWLMDDRESFSGDTRSAYAMAWGWTLFLLETRRDEYGEYLQRVGRGRPFFVPTPQLRLQDFQAAFGDDLDELEARFQQYFKKLHERLQ